MFKDARFPGNVRMTAFSPFIPHADRDSSMPVAMFAVELTNTTKAPLDYTLAGTLGNYGNNSGTHTFSSAKGVSTLAMTSGDHDEEEAHRGGVAISTDAANVQHQNYHHYRGQWFDDLTLFWKDFAKPGTLPERHYDCPRTRHMQQFPEHGTLAAKVTVAPGERKAVRFVISWSFPNGDIYWAYRNKPDGQIPDKKTPLWRNYYSTQLPASSAPPP